MYRPSAQIKTSFVPTIVVAIFQTHCFKTLKCGILNIEDAAL